MEKTTGLNWDLGLLYRSLDDPEIEVDLKSATGLAAAFAQCWRGRVHTVSAHFLEALSAAGARGGIFNFLEQASQSFSGSHQLF